MNEAVLDCIYAAIDEVNRERGDEPPLPKALDTPINGSESALDSLGLVNFIVIAEEKLEGAFQVPVMLSDDRALTTKPSPFLSVESLVEYVGSLLDETG